jgi:hypothetical protein
MDTSLVTKTHTPWREGAGVEHLQEIEVTPIELYNMLLKFVERRFFTYKVTRMPLCIFLQIFGCRYRNKELEEQKSSNVVIGDLAPELRDVLHKKRVWVRSLQVSNPCYSFLNFSGLNRRSQDFTTCSVPRS